MDDCAHRYLPKPNMWLDILDILIKVRCKLRIESLQESLHDRSRSWRGPIFSSERSEERYTLAERSFSRTFPMN